MGSIKSRTFVTYLYNQSMKKTLLLLLYLCIIACMPLHAKDFNIMDYGAVGDGVTDNAAAIQKAVNACSEAGGGRVVFPAGNVFMAGPVELKSNVELHLEANATLLAHPNEDIYHLSAFGENRGEGMMWLWCKDIENLSITGRGTIDGNGIAFMGAELGDSYELKPLKDPKFDPRPHVLTLIGVRHLLVRDVTIRNGAYWTVHLVGCEDANIEGISLLNNLKIRNGDGIDVDHSRKVRISNCYITSGDDCICLKNRREFEQYGKCEDIVVTNCVMTSRSCAIKIGSENMDSINRVMIDNCIITASNRGIGIQNRDEGTVTNGQRQSQRCQLALPQRRDSRSLRRGEPHLFQQHHGYFGEWMLRGRRQAWQGEQHLFQQGACQPEEADQLPAWPLRQAPLQRRGIRQDGLG